MALDVIPWNPLDHLETREAQAAYLEAALEYDDPSFVALVLGDIARARGVAAFSKETGISRETIYKTFRQGGNPTLATISKATRALGLKLKLVAA